MVAETCRGTFITQVLVQLVANQHDCVSIAQKMCNIKFHSKMYFTHQVSNVKSYNSTFIFSTSSALFFPVQAL